MKNDHVTFHPFFVTMARTKRDKAPKAGEHKEKLAAKKSKKSKVADGGGGAEVVVKPRRHRPCVVALRRIKQSAKSTDTCIQRSPFVRLVKEQAALKGVFVSTDPAKIRIQRDAADLMQRLVESDLTTWIGGGYALTQHREKDMLTAADLAMYEELQSGEPLQLAHEIRDQLCHAKAVLLKCEVRSQKAAKSGDKENVV